MSDLDDVTGEDDTTGGYDPEALERRRSQLAEDGRMYGRAGSAEPLAVRRWVDEVDEPSMTAFLAAQAELGPKPKVTSGPMGMGLRYKLAVWQEKWSAARLEMSRAQSALFSDVPQDLIDEHPDALEHLQSRARMRAKIVVQDTAHLAKRRAELKAAQAEMDHHEKPKRAGQELALLNVKLGFSKLAKDARKEIDRHAQALIAADRIKSAPTKAAALEEENERHEQANHALEIRMNVLAGQKAFLVGRLATSAS